MKHRPQTAVLSLLTGAITYGVLAPTIITYGVMVGVGGCLASGRTSGLDNSRNTSKKSETTTSQGDNSTSFVLQNIDFGPIISASGLGVLGLWSTLRSRKYRRVTELVMDAIEAVDSKEVKKEVSNRSRDRYIVSVTPFYRIVANEARKTEHRAIDRKHNA